MNSVSFTGLSDITISAEGANLPKVDRVVQMDFVDTDFSALVLSQPTEGETGVAEVPTFAWTNLPNADSYSIEIATSPAFGATTVETASGLTMNSFTPSIVLEKSTIYYWRIIPANACGEGQPTAISTFQTETLACNGFESGTLNEPISQQVNSMVSSKINISGGGTINDLNVSNVNISFTPVNALKIELESPGGKKAVLFDGNCSSTSLINMGFDSDAPNPISNPILSCPPVGGVASPIDDLSMYNGDNAQGEWTLTVTVLESGFSAGSLNEWSLEICSNSSVTGPSLITNEVLPVRTNDGQWISNLFLRVTDPNQGTKELIYTMVEVPEYGYLEKNDGTPYPVGSTFTQDDIDNKRIAYYHDGSAVSEDGFFFTVTDGEGGYIPKTKFSVNIDDNNLPLSVWEPLALEWNIFPNPAKDLVTINLGEAADQNLTVRILDLQGRLIERHLLQKGQTQLALRAGQWPAGMYFVEMSDGQALSTEKVLIQR